MYSDSEKPSTPNFAAAYGARPIRPANRCYLDDVPGAPLAEVWEHSFGHNDDAKKTRLDLSPKVGERGVFHGAYIAIPGVIDQHIQDAERLNCCIDSVPGLRFACHIQRKCPHPVAVPVDNVAELEGIAGCRDDAMARLEGSLHKCSAQTSRTTGNKPSLRLSDVHAPIVADIHTSGDRIERSAQSRLPFGLSNRSCRDGKSCQSARPWSPNNLIRNTSLTEDHHSFTPDPYRLTGRRPHPIKG